jgi:DNA-binding CsgD family transcriptional regulator
VLYGRETERARIDALLDAARASRSGALAIVGDPGIGKTALLEYAREEAADMHCLAARGVESESELPFAVLHQLVRPTLAEIDGLPGPQADALSAAFGMGGTVTAQTRFLAFAACLTLLSDLADERPVLCLVDDAHWLDTESATALQFVIRRLDAEGVVVLVAAREGEPATFDAPDTPWIRLGGLDADAAERLLEQGAAATATPGVRGRLITQTRGNALALLELPSALTPGQLAGDEPLPAELPLTDQVERAFLGRVRRLPPDAGRLLLVAAADDSESAPTVVRAFGEGGQAALDTAEQACLVSVQGGRLAFRHPLVRSAVYGAATSAERRAAHHALAEAFAGDDAHFDRRAWHLAAATLDPDESVLATLDEASARARLRGAYGAAARALERAAELSRDEAAHARRLVEAARCASVAGADEQATALAEQARPLVGGEPLTAAELAQVVGRARIRAGNPADVPRLLLEAARAVAPVDPRRALDLLLDAAWAAQESGDPESQLAACSLAQELAPSAQGTHTDFVGSMLAGIGAVAAGDAPSANRHLTRALALGAESENPAHAVWAGSCAMYLGDVAEGGRLLTRSAALARSEGALGILAPALALLGMQQFVAQRLDEALLAAVEGERLAREVGAVNLVAIPSSVLAGVAAIRGQDEEAIRHANAALELAAAHGLPVAGARPVWALALLDLGRGRWTDALARLDSIAAAQLGLASVLAVRAAPDRVEAAVRAGQMQTAREALQLLERWTATAASATWARPRLASCRALLAEGDDATTHFEEAVRLGDAALPFDLARIRLLYGEHLRRERRRTDSRVQFRFALEGFDRLGAEPWAERARAELRASGETARRRDPSTTAQLTPQELQIARFVAEGLSNKEVAAQLFLSPRTIDSHLRSVFSKLAINSRTQLARLQLGEELEPAPA